jgi:methionyl-tRNA synthetase
VPVPGDPDHVMYVWVDALTNYITSVGYPDDKARFEHYWPADLHVIGKDIVRFHSVYWPAFLMSAGIALPRRVFGHGFLFNAGEKMSNSVGNVLDPFDLVDAFGVDPLRHYLLREVPFGQDGNYSLEGFVARVNADLANDIGNLAQRSLSMIARNCEGRVPSPGPLTEEDKAILAAADGLMTVCRTAFDGQQIHQALGAIWGVIGDTNRYFASQEPWKLAKTDPARMATVLYVTIELVRIFATLTQPVMPDASAKLLDLLAIAPERRAFASIGDRIAAGTALPPPTGVFPKREREPGAAA